MTQMATKDRCPTCGSDRKHLYGIRSSTEAVTGPWELAKSGFVYNRADPWHEGRSPTKQWAVFYQCGKNMGNDLLIIPCDLEKDHDGPCERNVWPVNEVSREKANEAELHPDRFTEGIPHKPFKGPY